MGILDVFNAQYNEWICNLWDIYLKLADRI